MRIVKASFERIAMRNSACYCDMIFVSYITCLQRIPDGIGGGRATGPVNMMAIRRGVAVVGATRLPAESAPSSAICFCSPWPSSGSLPPAGTARLKLRIILVAIGAAVLVPVGIYFLALAVRDHRKAYKSARRRWSEGRIPTQLVAEAAKAPP